VRRRLALSQSSSFGPRVNKKPAMTIETRRSTRPNYAPWVNSSNLPPAGLSIGAASASACLLIRSMVAHGAGCELP
jgi:hypothetical protein